MMKKALIISSAIIILSIILIIAGIKLGWSETVYSKSTMICLECMGIG